MDKVCIVTTLSAPLHETISFVHYHINAGVDHLFLFFDEPIDAAIEHLEKYKQVTCIKCDHEYWVENKCTRPHSIEDRQAINANNAFATAGMHNYDWIIHIDSDELIYPDEGSDMGVKGFNNIGIKGLLSNVPDNVHVIVFDIREAVPEKLLYNNVFMEISLFKVPPNDYQESTILTKGYKHALFHGEYFRGHQTSKSAVRLSSPITSLGFGTPVGDPDKLVMKAWRAFKLLHFDCCEYEAWKTKWTRRIDGTATADHMRPNRNRQLEEFRAIYNNNPDQQEDLYKRMYFLPEEEKASLIMLGVLTHIDISKNLFERPG